MELIIIRGKENSGKSTTAAMVHNELVRNKAQVIILKFPCNWIEVGGKAQDFFSVFEYKGKKIAIISPGDAADNLANDMNIIIKEHHPDTMIVCARSIDKAGSAYRMLRENYGGIMNSKNEFWVEYVEDPTLMMKAKRTVVDKIMKKIL